MGNNILILKKCRQYLVILVSLLASYVDGYSQYRIKGIDVYDSSQITTEQVKKKYGLKFNELARQFPDGKDFEKILEEISSGIAKMGEIAYFNIGMTIHPDDLNGIYLSIDVVDEKDRVRRMSFLPMPTREISDPEGLLANWIKYEKKHHELFLKGELNNLTNNCPALHCIDDFSHPELKPYLEIFQSKSPLNKNELINVLRESKNAEHRAAAAFLLAHTSEAKALVQILEPSIADSDSTVRNNVIRVLSEIALRQKNVAINITPLIKALDYPNGSDRNKALNVLLSLADSDENKLILKQRAGTTLLKILRLTEPNNHDPAYQILKKISGEKYGEREYAKWANWVKHTEKMAGSH